MWRLLLLFTVVPALELFLLLQIGSVLGPTATFLLILLTGLAGASLARREGLGVLGDLQRELQRGLPPGDRLMEGVMVVVGGILLVTPGVLTDLVGFSLIVPATRKFLAPRVLGWLGQSVDVRVMADFRGPPPEPGAEGPSPFGDREAPKVRVRDVRGTALGGSDEASRGTPFSNKFDDLE